MFSCFLLSRLHLTFSRGAMKDKIWFTYKARIQAAHRLERNEFHSQALLVWYAFWSAALSIVTLRYPQMLGPDTDLFAAVLGVGLLAVSMFVTTQDFRGRFLEMRANYIALQRLHEEINVSGETAEVAEKYYQLLEAAENHSDVDDKKFRLFQVGGTSRPLAWYETGGVFIYLALRFGTLVVAYLLPIVPLIGLAYRALA